VGKSQTFFRWIFDLQASCTSTQLTVAGSLLVQHWRGYYRQGCWPMVWRTFSLRSCEWLISSTRTVWTHSQWPYMTFCVTGWLKYSVLHC